MRRTLHFLTFSLALITLGCDPGEHVILLTLYPEVPVTSLEVEVSSLEGLGTTIMARDENVNDEDGVQVAVVLAEPAVVSVHMVGTTAVGEFLVATRCYSVDGSIEDEVGLAGPIGGLDADGDMYPSDASAVCLEPDGDDGLRPCREGDLYLCDNSRAEDCDDTNIDIHPGARTFCQNGIDEDCDGEDEMCADLDGDGSNACPPGVTMSCDCDDSRADINPGVDEPQDAAAGVCNDGVDQNCDGLDTCCDADGDGTPQCATCADRAGVPAELIGQRCLNDASCSPVDPMTGEVIELVVDSCRLDGPNSGDCDDTDPTIFPGANERPCPDGSLDCATEERLCDGVDNNCNGLVDEVEECRDPDQDGDGAPQCGHPAADPSLTCETDEFDCDAGISPVNRERCGGDGLGVDEDADGTVDEGCPPGDGDMDGQVAPLDCNDSDPLAYDRNGFPGFTVPDIDRCGNGMPENCQPGGDQPCSADTDMDGYVELVPAYCEGNPALSPDVPEVCDGDDNDCDLITDELFDATGMTGCMQGTLITFGGTSVVGSTALEDELLFFNCGACRNACQAGVDNRCLMGQCDCSFEPGTGGCIDVLTAEYGSAPIRPVCDAACGGCADLDRDPDNCGACGRQCGEFEQCVAGQCVCGSDTGPMVGGGSDPEACQGGALECCGDVCIDVTDSELNCGFCGYECGPHTICNNRVCQCDPAMPDWDDCDGDEAADGGNGCETNINIPNDQHCGACGNTCTPNARCNSSLVCECNSQQLDCLAGRPWCETPFSTSNCGACGAGCGSMESCNPSGQCVCGSTSGSVGGGRACGSNERCCSGSCENLDQTNNCGGCGVTCGTDETCSSRECFCSGQSGGGGRGAGPRCTGAANTCCPGDGCRDTDNDANHCGGCGTQCGTDETCSGARCRCAGDSAAGGPACTGSTDTCCPGVGCVDTDNDASHCGGCGIACGPGETCSGGECQCMGEGSGGGVGGGRLCTGSGVRCCPGSGCVNTNSDASHCGGCNMGCGVDEGTCQGGSCECGTSGMRCGGGATSTCCGNSCVNLNTSASHCGGCGSPCPADEGTCSSGMCQCNGGSRCGGGASDTCCGTAGCVNLNSDTSHCGACMTSCGGSESCASGACECGTDTGSVGGGAVCGSGGRPTTCCPSDACVDITSDPAHCDGCGNNCPDPANAVGICTSSSCDYTCLPGFEDCDGMAGNGCEAELAADSSNCGACGAACVSGASCVSSVCLCSGAGGDRCFDGQEGDRCSGSTCRCGGGGSACMPPTTTCQSMMCM